MLVIIVGDDQAIRLQLARAIGPGRFELLCAVPTADVVPPVEDGERVAALLAHRSVAALKLDVARLRKRFEDRVVCIAVVSDDGRELDAILETVDDFVGASQSAALLHARLVTAYKRFSTSKTARSARPTRNAVEDLMRAALGSGRDHLYVWDLSTGRIDWPFEGEAIASGELALTRNDYDDALHADDRLAVEVGLERHFTSGTPFAVGVRRGSPDDGYTLYIDRGSLVGSRRDGRFIGLLTSVEAEVQIELNRRMELRRSSLAEIAGALAEELSASLLGAFTGLDSAIAQVPGQVRGELEDARVALQGALDWTRRLMALGRRQPPSPEYLALQDLVQDLVDPLARRLGGQIAFEVVSRDATGIVLADPMHIETVLSIVCDRAAKQMPDGGRVRLTLGSIIFRDETGPLPPKPADGRWAKLRIEDEGPHVPEAMAVGGFDPMSHGQDEGLRWSIALATVRSIVLQHEGIIRVLNLWKPDGSPGGVAFEIYLPAVLRAPARLRRPETGSHMPVGSGELVLVADDDELVRRMSERLLRGAGYDVVLAPDGREAVRIFAERQAEIKLVVLDIVMPEMGGRVASERIRALSETVPFLFTSGYTMSIQDTEFIQGPGRHFLPKPFNAGQLLREVRATLYPTSR